MITDQKQFGDNMVSMLGRLPLACMLLDRSGSIHFANKALLALLKYSEQQLIGENIESIVNRSGNTEHNTVLLSSTILSRHAEVFLDLKTQHGETQSVVLTTSPPTENDDAGYILGIVTLQPLPSDHTISMVRNRARLKACFDNDSRGMAIVDHMGRWNEVNTALCKILEYEATEFQATNFQALTHTEDLDKEMSCFNEILNGKSQGYQLEKRFYSANGSTITTLINVNVIGFAATDKIELLYEVNDISLQKDTEIQLEQAQKLEDSSHLLCGISHDFSNALTIIQNNLDLLKPKDINNSDAAKRIRIALNAIQGAAGLNRRLLAFSSAQQEESSLVNINELLQKTYELIGHIVGNQICFNTTPGEDLWLTDVDPIQLESVLINLAINARHAMPDGGKLEILTNNISVETFSTDVDADSLPGDFVQISVADNGAGIPFNVRNKVFQPFFTTKPSGKGSGLGLSMVYGFVKQHGGHVKISSEESCGTSVHLYLPRYQHKLSNKQNKLKGKTRGGDAKSVNSDLAGI